MTHPRKAARGGFCVWISLIVLSGVSIAEQKPLTVAESSDFKATSRLADIQAFVKELQRLSPNIRLETLCTSTEGRDVPLLIIGKPAPSSPSALKDDKRLVIYIQANIHAGEVEGKEASQMLARDLALNDKLPYLDRLVVLIAPDFNADGNEKISPENRSYQPGPEQGVGVRPNGQNLDLNRDSMKLESPELQGLLKNVLRRWDPALLLDLHTTDGSFREDTVSYCWPLNPNGDKRLIEYQRSQMLPAIGTILLEKYKNLSVPYGEFRDFKDPGKGWEAFDHIPRFVTNYTGLRNRLAFLDENDVHADYKTRVLSCYHWLLAVLDYCHGHSEEISGLVSSADQRTIQRGLNPSEQDGFIVEYELKQLPEPVTLHSWEMEVIPREGGWPEIKKTDKRRNYVMPYFAEFQPKRRVKFPAAYLLPDADSVVIEKLDQHGVNLERLASQTTLEVESFRIKEIKAAQRLYQGHWTNQVKGEYVLEKREFPKGTVFVSTAQPLGVLAAYLLEPESDDGLLVWNFFDRYLVPEWGRGYEIYPVFRLLKPTNMARVAKGIGPLP